MADLAVTVKRKARLVAFLVVALVVAGYGCERSSAPSGWQDRSVAFKICHMDLMFPTKDPLTLPDHIVRDQDGNATVSWRYACGSTVWEGRSSGTPADDIVRDVTVPWDDPSQKHWHDRAMWTYCFQEDVTTNVMALVGKGTAFESGKSFVVRDLPNDLILLIEVQGTGVHWMQPVDLEIGQLVDILDGKEVNVSLGTSEDGFIVAFLDGEVWMLSHATPKDELLKFCSRDSAARHDREVVLGPFQIARARSGYGPRGPG